MITAAGFVVFLISIGMLGYALLALIQGRTVAGWTSVIGSIWLLGGIQLLGIGIVGEYLAKVYRETKRRPRFVVARYLNRRGDGPAVDRQSLDR